jgi:hypothetical protein
LIYKRFPAIPQGGFVAKRKVQLMARMPSSPDRSLERHLLEQIAAIAKRIAELTAEQAALQRLLERTRHQLVPNVDVTRKNSHQRILVEKSVVDSLSAGEIRTAKTLCLDARLTIPDLKSSTFRSYLRRMQQRGLIAPMGSRGSWMLVQGQSERVDSDSTGSEPREGVHPAPFRLSQRASENVRGHAMERQRVAEAALLGILIHETGRALGKDANFLGEKIEIRKRNGEPNWDANCGIAGPPIIKAFATALNKTQALYNLD